MIKVFLIVKERIISFVSKLVLVFEKICLLYAKFFQYWVRGLRIWMNSWRPKQSSINLKYQKRQTDQEFQKSIFYI